MSQPGLMVINSAYPEPESFYFAMAAEHRFADKSISEGLLTQSFSLR
jgi:hypothetical protein